MSDSFERLRLEDCHKLQTTLGYRLNSGSAWETEQDPVSKTQININQRE